MKNTLFFLALSLLAIACNDNDTGYRNGNNTDDAKAYLLQGDSIAKITSDTLRATLLKAIGEKGFSGALAFCNARAMTVTAMYGSEGITVGRVSYRNRNPENVLSEGDMKEWVKYMGSAAKKDSLKSVVVFRNHAVHYYKPILIQSMCLTCHGTPGKDIPKDLLLTIDSLYPADKAKGYKQGELRGMWHIVFSDLKAGPK